MTSRDTLQTSTTVCPAVMVEGPSMVTLGGGAVRGGREGEGKEVYYGISSSSLGREGSCYSETAVKNEGVKD